MNLQTTSSPVTRAFGEHHERSTIHVGRRNHYKLRVFTPNCIYNYVCAQCTKNEKLFLCQQCNYKILQPQTTSLRQRKKQRQHSKKLHHVPTCAWKRATGYSEKLTAHLLARSLFTTLNTNTSQPRTAKSIKEPGYLARNKHNHAHAAGLWSACTSFPCVFRFCM